MSDTAGLWVSGEEWPVGDTSLDDILDLYEDAWEWLETSAGGYGCAVEQVREELTRGPSVDMDWKSHLQKRLTFRKVGLSELPFPWVSR